MSRKITKIDIITRPSKLEDLKDALNKIGVHGMTVSQVYGCGTHRGHKEKLETVVCEIPVEKVLEVAQKILRTGEFGDGKIFVYELEDAVRIRTGHRGVEAIMDIPGEQP